MKKKQISRKRTIHYAVEIKFRTSEDQKSQLEQFASEAGLEPSTYLRWVLKRALRERLLPQTKPGEVRKSRGRPRKSLCPPPVRPGW